MRIIKFRGKDATGQKGWVYGDLVHGYEVVPDTVGQFTGLLDKNGKEIYEGDIIKCGGCKPLLEVRVVSGVFSFLWGGDLDNKFSTGSPTHEWAEVVGNIHDNPELLLLF